MAMSNNPALSDKILKREIQADRAARPGAFDPSWGSPSDDLPPGVFEQPAQATGVDAPHRAGPIVDRGDTMRVGGAITATAVLLAITAVAFVWGWSLVTPTYGPLLADGTREPIVDVPGWLIVLALASFGVAILNSFKPRFSIVTGPVYAVMMGIFVGALSHAFEAFYEGIVVQAVAATVAVFTAMLGLYATRIIRVTERMRSTIVAAMAGIAVLYLVSIGMNLIFGVRVPFVYDSGPLGILISIVICGVAAFSLLLDFDFIERGAQMGAPRYMEWYAAFGLMAGILWLYIEILRLLAKLRDR